MDNISEAAERSKQLKNLYDKYLYLENRFYADPYSLNLVILNAAVTNYSELLEKTNQEVFSRK